MVNNSRSPNTQHPGPREIEFDWTRYDAVVFTPEHPEGIWAFGTTPDEVVAAIEDHLAPGRESRIKFKAIREVFGGR